MPNQSRKSRDIRIRVSIKRGGLVQEVTKVILLYLGKEAGNFMDPDDIFAVMTGEGPLIFFDGVCHFCNYWVRFAIRHDRNSRLMFAPLQGETARKYLSPEKTGSVPYRTVVFMEKEKIWTHSSAVLRICRKLDGGWKLFYVFIIIPKFIRDLFYSIIARNRYRWFGRDETCMVPAPEIRQRFLP